MAFELSRSMSDWRRSEADRRALIDDVAAGRLATTPFSIVTSVDDPALQLHAARAFVEAEELADQRHRLADLFLDTFPCNAHTTASDALWAGLPLFTCAGRSFAARVAGSLLRAVGLPELVTASLGEYEAMALELARSPERLSEIRTRLQARRATAPLFDAGRLARHLESAYLEMWRLNQAGAAPRSFAVSPV